MVAAIGGIKMNKISVDLSKGEHLSEAMIKMNPTCKVPFIIDGQLRLNESRAIAAYLCNRYMPQDNTLYPRDPVKRARVDELLHFDVSSLYHNLSVLLRPKLFGIATELDSEKDRVVRDNLGYLEERLRDSTGTYLLGNDVTIADIAIASTLTFPQALDYDMEEFTLLKDYRDSLRRGIPEYSAINDRAIENMRWFAESNRDKQQL